MTDRNKEYLKFFDEVYELAVELEVRTGGSVTETVAMALGIYTHKEITKHLRNLETITNAICTNIGLGVEKIR
jgi:hypothetical protein